MDSDMAGGRRWGELPADQRWVVRMGPEACAWPCGSTRQLGVRAVGVRGEKADARRIDALGGMRRDSGAAGGGGQCGTFAEKVGEQTGLGRR
jgi:hypothetical protein